MIDILHACHLLVQTCKLYLRSNLGLRFFLQALLERTVSGVALDVAVQGDRAEDPAIDPSVYL